MNAQWLKHTLKFKQPAGTSRGVLQKKPSWFIKLTENVQTGIGECGLLSGLSFDDRHGFEARLQAVCQDASYYLENLEELAAWPSIRAGLEMANQDLHAQNHVLFPGDFTRGKASIVTNGLIWMGTAEFMAEQIEQKLKDGFGCIKVKIGAMDFERELSLLRGLRQHFPASQLQLRVDANGAFSPSEAPGVLEKLAQLDLHSIEQPIPAGQWQAMAQLCANSPIPVALDEELIGVTSATRQKRLMETIRPQHLILKPSLLGGFAASNRWIKLARQCDSRWWVTSALESNLGLNAIAQWTATLDNPLPQGLGTGQLYSNNFDCPLYLTGEELHFDPTAQWNLSKLTFNHAHGQ